MAAERPRRSTRVPTKYSDSQGKDDRTASASTSKKRKTLPHKDGGQDVTSPDYLLTNPKSPLVNVEMSTLINHSTWSALSQDSRTLLSTMLPPTVFPFFRPSLGKNHPSNKQGVQQSSEVAQMDVDVMALASELDQSFFTEPFFEASMRTFQDHLYSGWLTPAHDALLREYTESLQSGKIHAPWKDDVWAEEHPVIERHVSDNHDGLAGDASSITLKELAKHSIIRVGDVLAYRRHFPQLNCTVTKDVLVDSIQPSTHSITVLIAPATQTHLPLAYLQHPETVEKSPDENPEVLMRSTTITNPSQLESAVLDIHGGTDKNRKRNPNAWKTFTLWRWRDGELPDPSAHAGNSEEAMRGYREYRGTLFYLRGCFYDDF